MAVEELSAPRDRSLWQAWRKPLRWLVDNPVVLKELRGRMRGSRAFVVLTVYLVLLGSFSSLIYLALAESTASVSGQASIGEIGRTLFGGVVAIEMLLVMFISPTFTSGAISGEREHQTFDLLRTTLLPAHSFVFGKLASAISYILLLLFAAVPLQSIAFFFGGVTETEVFLSFIILLMTSLLFSTIGLYFSARSRRTLSANVLTYSTTMFVLFGVPILWAVVMVIAGSSMNDIEANGQIALLYVSGAVFSTNPAITAMLTQYFLTSRQSAGFFSYTLTSGDKITLVSPWIPFTVLYLVLSLLFFEMAVRQVRRIED